MVSAIKFYDTVEAIGLGEHDFSNDTLKVYLTNNKPSVSNDADKGDLAGITEEHGYAPADIQNVWSESSGTGTLTATDVVFTASGGTVGPFRYVVIYNDTHASDGLICYYDYGSVVTLQSGESFTVDFGASVFTLA